MIPSPPYMISSKICQPKLIWLPEFGGQPVPPALLDDLRRLAGAGPLAQLCELLTASEVAALERRVEAVVDGGRFPIDRTGRRYPWPLV